MKEEYIEFLELFGTNFDKRYVLKDLEELQS